MYDLVRRMRRSSILQFFTIYLRYLIGGTFVMASMVKILGHRFTLLSTETEVGCFFEAMYQTGAYWRFLGWAQFGAAVLLMTQRFATLGAMMFFGVVTNIVVITYSVDFGTGTPIVTTGLLLAVTYLLVWDYAKLRFLFQNHNSIKADYTDETPGIEDHFWWVCLGTILLTISVYFGIERQRLVTWFLLSVATGLAGLPVYVCIQRRSTSTNVTTPT